MLTLATVLREPMPSFSIDDVFECLIDATENHSSLFEQPLFNFLSLMHRTYGVHVDLYLFNRAPLDGRMRTLCDVAERFRDEFQEATWLRLGLVPEFKRSAAQAGAGRADRNIEETYSQIERFAGPQTGFLRLHFFSRRMRLLHSTPPHGYPHTHVDRQTGGGLPSG